MKRELLAVVLLSGMALSLIYRDRLDIEQLRSMVEASGGWGPALFVLVYALATVLFVPGSLLTLTGGLLFGPVWGTLLNLSGATLGATAAFLLSRYLAGDWVERHTDGRLSRLREGVEAEGWRFVAFVRLVPLFPFNLLNYALGLTRIPLGSYAFVSALAMLPGALAYSWLGYLGGEAASGSEDLVRKLLVGLALLAVALFLPCVWLRLRESRRRSMPLSR